MDCLLIIYLFFLFVLFTPNNVFKIPIKNNLMCTVIHGLLFVILFQITYAIIKPTTIENLEVSGNNTDSLVNIVKMISEYVNRPNHKKEYQINNELIQVTPEVAKEYDIIDEEKLDSTIIVPPIKARNK